MSKDAPDERKHFEQKIKPRLALAIALVCLPISYASSGRPGAHWPKPHASQIILRCTMMHIGLELPKSENTEGLIRFLSGSQSDKQVKPKKLPLKTAAESLCVSSLLEAPRACFLSKILTLSLQIFSTLPTSGASHVLTLPPHPPSFLPSPAPAEFTLRKLSVPEVLGIPMRLSINL